ncbi:MAG: sugar ABC transporter substrate-binding protein [Anaerolineae bacterium]|nr:sugar ABC transporter substrate-binding protein [Anaerolineae bacterium]
MKTFAPGTVVRVLQEDWAPFQNIYNTTPRFTEQTGIRVEVKLSSIPELWDLMNRSFVEDPPPFDLVGMDEIMLMQHVRLGRAEPLDDHIAADGYPLDDFEPAALEAASYRGQLYGLPYADVSNVLIYRADLFTRYGIPVPQTMDALTEAALAVQEAVRADGTEDFYGITLRGAPSCGLNFWHIGSTWIPAWGAQWYDAEGRPTIDRPEHIAALAHYVDLLHRAGPPETPTMGFVECMEAYASGRAAMVIEPANEASIVYNRGGAVAEGTLTTLVPAGPRGTRHAGLYCPPYAIPARSKVKEAAWALATFLCAPEQLLDDAVKSGFVEVARKSVLNDPQFAAHFPANLVETTRATRAIARPERPTPRQGMLVGDIIGEEATRALAGAQTAREALQRAQERIAALGSPD